MRAEAATPLVQPVLSVIILNYNGARWMARCLDSVRAQTIYPRIEVIVADNLSSDGSDRTAQATLASWPNGKFVQNGGNLGFCEGNNRPARLAKGEFLLFLNNDTWLEPVCLENLVEEVRRLGAHAATPLICNYDDDSFQSLGAAGFDVFGLSSTRRPHSESRRVLMPEGCAYLIQRELFERLGGFDREFFMYGEEMDLSWRVWLSGHEAVAVPAARLHHRRAAHANPKGGGSVVEFRTNAATRYYSNRNSLLLVFKSAQHLLLLLALMQIALLMVEAVVALALIRDWQFVRRAYWQAVMDCWPLRHHVLAERRRIRQLRERGDFWMLRFLKLRPNRWDELQRVRRLGLPKVTAP